MPHVTLSWLKDHVEIPAEVTLEEVSRDLVSVGLEEEQIIPPALQGPLVAGRILKLSSEKQTNGKIINYCRVDVGKYNDPAGAGKEPADTDSVGIVCGAHNFQVGDTVVVALPGAVLPADFAIKARKTYGHISQGMICSARELGLGEDHSGILVLDEFWADCSLPSPGEDLLVKLGLGEEVLEVNVTPDRGYCFSVRGIAREYAGATGYSFSDPGAVGSLTLPQDKGSGFEVVVEEAQGAGTAAALSGAGPSLTDLAATSTRGGFGTGEAGTDRGDPGETGISRLMPAHKVGEAVGEDSSETYSPLGCDRFVTRVVTGIDPKKKSPDWLVRRLEACGMRSISLAVDATNYVMLDLGQPLHAYDLDYVRAPFVVRRARPEETMTTIDEVERKLNTADLLITDSPEGNLGSRIVGLAGVMGGANSEIKPDTTAVVIEAAHFDSLSIARTSRFHQLYSEASKRFERGVDPLLPPVAVQRVVDLLVEYGGARASEDYFDLDLLLHPNSPSSKDPSVILDLDLPQRITGVDYSLDTIKAKLELIGAKVVPVEETTLAEGRDADAKLSSKLKVTPPTWRFDLNSGPDLVEEIARLDGYDKIASVVPVAPGWAKLNQNIGLRNQVARMLASLGLVEVKSYPFISNTHDRQQLSPGDVRRRAVRLLNPLAETEPYLRTSILDTLLDTASLNLNRFNDRVAIFELGRVFATQIKTVEDSYPVGQKPPEDKLGRILASIPEQPWKVAAVLLGETLPPTVGGNSHSWDYSHAIDLVCYLLDNLSISYRLAPTWTQEKKPAVPKQNHTKTEDLVKKQENCQDLSKNSNKVYQSQTEENCAVSKPQGLVDSVSSEMRFSQTATSTNPQGKLKQGNRGAETAQGALTLPTVTDAELVAPWHPSRSAYVYQPTRRGYQLLGTAGELHPKVCREFQLPPHTVAFELDCDLLATLASTSPVTAKPISIYPPARQDLALLVPEGISVTSVIEVIQKVAQENLEYLYLYDIYTSDQIPPGYKSYTFKVSFRSLKSTLESDELQEIRARILKNLDKKLSVRLRY